MHQYEMRDNHSVRLDKAKFTDSSRNEYIEYQGYLYPVGQTPLQGAVPTSGAQYDPARNQVSSPTTKFESSLYARAFGNTVLPGSKNANGQDVGKASGDGLSHWRTIAETTTNQTLNDQAHTPVKARGVVLLQYYTGVTVNGTLVDDAGAPMAGFTVAFRDGNGAAHGKAITDSAGHFTVLAPFSQGGDLKLEVLGSANGVLYSDNRTDFQFSLDQARSGGSAGPFTVHVPRGNLAGLVYEEKNGNSTYEPGADAPLAGATVAMSGGHYSNTTADGTFHIDGMQVGDYSVVASHWPEYANSTAKTVSVTAGGTANVQIGLTLRPATVHAKFEDAAGAGVPNVPLEFRNTATGASQRQEGNATGIATTTLAPGTWAVTVDYNVTTAAGNDTAPVTTHYVGHATVEVRKGEGEKSVTVKQDS
ncbi:MAG: carboxypeptidase regulatory-like domain-containing protein [Thermoplasmatota archaeon]